MTEADLMIGRTLLAMRRKGASWKTLCGVSGLSRAHAWRLARAAELDEAGRPFVGTWKKFHVKHLDACARREAPSVSNVP